jgi:hypothetical protein
VTTGFFFGKSDGSEYDDDLPFVSEARQVEGDDDHRIVETLA